MVIEEATEWCREYTIKGTVSGTPQTLDGSYEVCICDTSQPSNADLDDACYSSWLFGGAINCDPNGPVEDTEELCSLGGSTGTPYYGTGGAPESDCPDNPGPDDHVGPDGFCCDPDLQTDCCEFGGQACPNYDYEAFPYQTRVPVSPYSASLSGSSLELVFAEGTGDEDSDSVSMTGTMDYAMADCGETWCPFFLNNLEASATGSLDLDIKIGNKTRTKTLSNLTMELLYPVVGIHHIGEVQIGTFSKYGLMVHVEFDISGHPPFDDENGHYSFITANTADIATTNNSAAHTFTFTGLASAIDLSTHTGIDLTANVSQSVSLTDGPPFVSAFITTETCNPGVGQQLNFFGASTDPDTDIAVELWWLNGTLRAIDDDFSVFWPVSVPAVWEFGAFDSRGAFQSVAGVKFACE